MNSCATFIFFNSLNDFLPKLQRGKVLQYYFKGHPAIKDAIEALGVPHPEVAAIRVNGRFVNFGYSLAPDDRVEVYPLSPEIKTVNTIALRPPFPAPIKFVLDVHLGKLARNLRMLGFDAIYENDLDDGKIAEIAAVEKRIVLTRDINLLKLNKIVWAYWLRSQNSGTQLKEVVTYFDLQQEFAPFTRCMACNGLVLPVEKKLVSELLLPNTRRYFHDFYQCQNCRKIYWKGSHYEKMLHFITNMLCA